MSARPVKCGARPSSRLRRSATVRAMASRAESVAMVLESLVMLRWTSKGAHGALASRALSVVMARESLVTLRRRSQGTPGALATRLRMRKLSAYPCALWAHPRAMLVTAAKLCATSANSD